jgi:hypothetical protein
MFLNRRRCVFLAIAAPFLTFPCCSLLSLAVPYYPSLLLSSPCCSLLPLAVPYYFSLFLTNLLLISISRCSLLSLAVPYYPSLFPTIPRCSLQAPAVPYYPSLFLTIPFCSLLPPRCSIDPFHALLPPSVGPFQNPFQDSHQPIPCPSTALCWPISEPPLQNSGPVLCRVIGGFRSCDCSALSE